MKKEPRVYDVGNSQTECGYIFKDAIKELVSALPSVLPVSFFEMKKKLLKKYPYYYGEVCDRARGAGVEPDKLLAGMVLANEELGTESCTDIIVVRPDGRILFGHNEDGHYTADNSALVTYRGANCKFTEFSIAESMPGYTFLWNERGLITSANFIHMRCMRPEEISCQFVLRSIAECGSIGEIKERLKDISAASGVHLNVVDTNIGRAYSIEMMFTEVNIMEIVDFHAHTNHFIRLGDGYRKPGSNTKNRLAYVSGRLEADSRQTFTVERLKDILEYTNEDYMHTVHGLKNPDNLTTAAMMCYDSGSGLIEVKDYLNDLMFQFSL